MTKNILETVQKHLFHIRIRNELKMWMNKNTNTKHNITWVVRRIPQITVLQDHPGAPSVCA